MHMRHGVPRIKMKDDILRSYIPYILLNGRGSTGHGYFAIVNVKFTIKRVLLCGCRCFEIYYGKKASLAETRYRCLTFRTYRGMLSAARKLMLVL